VTLGLFALLPPRPSKQALGARVSSSNKTPFMYIHMP
jgi:hypothetical protein